MSVRLFRQIVQRKKRRKFFRCGRKVGYFFASQAARGMERLQERQGEDKRLEIYHCGQCGGFHVGREQIKRERDYGR